MKLKVSKRDLRASIVHPFNNNWNDQTLCAGPGLHTLQSYILSTTTETTFYLNAQDDFEASIVHPFNNNWNRTVRMNDILRLKLQSYILSTTTETSCEFCLHFWSVLQSYILSTTTETDRHRWRLHQLSASIVHPFNNNWNIRANSLSYCVLSFNRTSFQQQLKQLSAFSESIFAYRFNRTSFQQQLKQYLHNQLPTVLWYNSHIDLLL